MIRSDFGVLALGVLLVSSFAGSSSEASYRREEVTVTAADGERLVASVWVPSGPGPQPAILLAHGFGGTRNDLNRTAERYAELGYVSLAWDARGFGQSGGTIGLNGPKEVSDVSRLITYLASRPEVVLDAPGDPRVGMQGGSYGGAIQLLAAANDPRIDAIAPMITWNDLVYSLYPNGVLKQGWTVFYYGMGSASGHGATGANPNAGGMDPSLTEAFVDTMSTNELSAKTQTLLSQRSPSKVLDRVRAPTLLVQGWHDTLFTSNEAAWTYEALRNNGVPAKLILYSGGHAYDETLTFNERDLRNATLWAWMDYWLKDQGTPDDVFDASVHWWDGTVMGFRPEQSWPVVDAEARPFYFDVDASGAGRLQSTPPTTPTRALLGSGGLTSYSEVPGLQSRLPTPAAETPATSIDYRTGALASELVLLGEPTLRLQASTSAADASLFIKVYDEAPDGTETLLDRQVTPLRIRGPDVALASPRTYEIPLTILHDTIRAGHGIRVTIATSDAAFSPSRAAGAVALVHDPAHPALLTLPIVSRSRDADVEPPTIGGVRVHGSSIRAELTDDSGVASAFLFRTDGGNQGIVVGVPGADGSYTFTLSQARAGQVVFRLVASDASGNRAHSGTLQATLEDSLAASAGAPLPGGLAMLAFGVAALAMGWRRKPPGTDMLMRKPR